MSLDLDQIYQAITQTNQENLPPVHLWHPEREGEIDIVIDHSANWFHEGGEFQRLSLVKLLSSILRLEGENYYLVTPAEKLKISVEDVPFAIVSLLQQDDDLILVTNTEQLIHLDGDCVWQLREYQGQPVPYVELRDGLFARVSRHVYYQMVEQAEHSESEQGNEVFLRSSGLQFSLGHFQ